MDEEFDREIRELTFMYVKGKITKQEFESRKKKSLARQFEEIHRKNIQSGNTPPSHKASNKGKGIGVLLVLVILVLSSFVFVFINQTPSAVDTANTEERGIIEQIASLPKALIEENPATAESPINIVIKNDTSKHVFTSSDFDNATSSIVKSLPFTGMRSMEISSFSLDRSEGIIDLSQVNEGYVLYPSKSGDGSEVYITLFLVEKSYQNKFFTELCTYLGKFDPLRKGYKKSSDLYLTELSSVGYKYTYTENGNIYGVTIVSIKSSNIVGFIYYLDPSEKYIYQKDVENTVKTVLSSFN